MNQKYITKAKKCIKHGTYKSLKPLLIILMGLPGTGKSYLSDYLHRKYSFTILSGENITHSIFGAEKCSGYQYKEAYKILRLLSVKSLKQKYNVVIDGTNLKYEFRKQIYEAVGRLSKIILIYLFINDATALKRANLRGENYSNSKMVLSTCPPKTFTAFKKQLELPQQDEQCYQIKSDNKLFKKIDAIIKHIIIKDSH